MTSNTEWVKARIAAAMNDRSIKSDAYPVEDQTLDLQMPHGDDRVWS